MNEKMDKIINTSLEILEIHTEELLKKAKENIGDSNKMEKNLRILNVIGCDMERLQRLQLEQPLSGFVD